MHRLQKKLLAKLKLSELYCDKCGGNLKPEGYRYTICQSCNDLVEWEHGNLGVEGKGHLYLERK